MKEILVAGAMALSLLAQETAVAQDAPAAQTTTAQSAQIPDAPRPQTPGIGPVTPGKGTTAPITPADAADDGFDKNVGSSLPSSTGAKVDPDADPSGATTEVPAAGQGSQVFTLRGTGANFVEIPFTVKDNKGHEVPGVLAREVRVYENGLRQHNSVFTVDPFPLSIAVVIDQSLTPDVMTRVNNALGALQGAFTPYDEVAVLTYNNGPRLVTNFTGGQSARLIAAVERSKSTGREQMYYAPGEGLGAGINLNNGAQEHINPLTTGGGVSSPQGLQQVTRESHTLNDAILEAAKVTTRAGKGRRRIVYVISDGKEYGSKAKTKQVIEYLQTNKVQVYATLVGDSSVSGLGFLDHYHLPLMMRDNILPQYTKATGGQVFAEYRTRGIENSFAAITEQVRTQYTIGYYTREPFIDGKFRKVEVRVMRPNLTVIAKDGYYPSVADTHPAAVQAPAMVTP